MQLDVHTLSVVTVFVTALLGALLLFAGLQNRNIGAPMWWGAGQIMGAIGLGVQTGLGTLPDFVAVDLGTATVLLGFGLTWTGARVFNERPARLDLLLLAPGLWLVATRVPVLAEPNARVIVASTLMAMLAAGTAEEFWRGREEPLMSRRPTVLVLFAYAAALLARIPATIFLPVLEGDTLMAGVSFLLLAFGTLLFTVVTAFLLLNMTKERTELQHKIASLIDPLSGVPNRRSFLIDAKKLIASATREGEPVATLLFDLDHFKEINDRRGHAVGDTVLQIFAGTATRTLGGEALFGRIGGEEFAALLPAGEIGEAHAVADRVRRNFAAAATELGGEGLRPTVSIGVTMCGRESDVNKLLSIADRALYRAKALGRNRVETLEPDSADVAGVGALTLVPAIDRPAASTWSRNRAARA
jgi:diguanylate cyclase (GGDEF)-like protein